VISKGRRAWLDREKAQHPGSMSRSEVMLLLGWSESTMKRAVRTGRIPPAEARSASDWPLWTAEQVKALLALRIEGRL
jgi:hypothetical protein